jgi:hypothetical protein
MESFNDAQYGPACSGLQPIAVKAGFRPVLKRFDATLQLGGSLRIRSDSRTHR